MAEHARVDAGGEAAHVRVSLERAVLRIVAGRAALVAVPSMEHPAFQRVLERGWVSPPSFGPAGDLRIFSAAHTPPDEEGYAWFASADWRRGRIQVDRKGAISDIAMEPYGGGRGKVRGELVEIALDHARGRASVTVADVHQAEGTWTDRELALEADEEAAGAVDGAFAAALFLWCARPEAFLVRAARPF